MASNGLDFTQAAFIESLAVFEYASRMQDADHCWQSLFSTLDKLQEVHNKGGLAHCFNFSDIQKLAIYTRFMAAVANWAARKEITLSYQQFLTLSHIKKLMVSIANASGYCGTYHYLNLLSESAPGEPHRYRPEKLTMLFALVALDDLPTQLLQLALQQNATVFLPYFLGGLSERFVLTEQGERNRTLLLQNSAKIVDAQIPPDEVNRLLNAMSSVWMYCSYAQYEGKHQIKKHLNQLIVRYVFNGNTQFMIKPPKKRKKPVMVVVHERFTHSHAMYRCWAPVIKGLAAHFDMISLGIEGYVDDCTQDIFSESFICPKSMPLPAIIQKIQSYAPDAMFYPSVGMQLQIIGLANVRLAPVQFAGTGHPATTMSAEMDYIVTSGDQRAEQCFSEKTIFHNQYTFIPHPQFSSVKIALKPRETDRVVIGIHGKVMKLNNGLMRIIEQVQQQTKISIEFRFYPGEYGIYYEGTKRGLGKRVTACHVLPTMNYVQFLERINQCDFFINPFPFGNTNSLVDCLLLHKPVVAMDGRESHTQIDGIILEKVGLAQQLLAHSEQEYIHTILRLIHDHEFFYGIVQHLIANNTYHQLFSEAENDIVDARAAELMKDAFVNK